jgi:hypothetical protein
MHLGVVLNPLACKTMRRASTGSSSVSDRRCVSSARTPIHGTNGIRAEWAMGWSEDPKQSALRAVIACANRLLA